MWVSRDEQKHRGIITGLERVTLMCPGLPPTRMLSPGTGQTYYSDFLSSLTFPSGPAGGSCCMGEDGPSMALIEPGRPGAELVFFLRKQSR